MPCEFVVAPRFPNSIRMNTAPGALPAVVHFVTAKAVVECICAYRTCKLREVVFAQVTVCTTNRDQRIVDFVHPQTKSLRLCVYGAKDAVLVAIN